MGAGLVGEGGGGLGGGELPSELLVGVVEAALKLAVEVPSGVLNGVVEVVGLPLPSGVPGLGGEAVPAGRRGWVRTYGTPNSDGRMCLQTEGLVQAWHYYMYCQVGSIPVIVMQARQVQTVR